MRKAFMVQVLGYWGRGKTLPEAAQNCYRAGASRNDSTIIDLIIGDETPEIANQGMTVLLADGAQVIRIANGLRLHQLLRVTV